MKPASGCEALRGVWQRHCTKHCLNHRAITNRTLSNFNFFSRKDAENAKSYNALSTLNINTFHKDGSAHSCVVNHSIFAISASLRESIIYELNNGQSIKQFISVMALRSSWQSPKTRQVNYEKP